MKTFILALLLATSAVAQTPTPGAGYLGQAEEGSFYTLKMTLKDAAGLPVTPAAVSCWTTTKEPSGAGTIVFDCGTLPTPTSNIVSIELPEEANRILSDSSTTERRIVTVRVRVGSRYKTFFPEYDVVNKRGFQVVNGVLVPNATPTP